MLGGKCKFKSFNFGKWIRLGFNVRMLISYCPSHGSKWKQKINMQQKPLFTFDKQHMVEFQLQEWELSAFNRWIFFCLTLLNHVGFFQIIQTENIGLVYISAIFLFDWSGESGVGFFFSIEGSNSRYIMHKSIQTSNCP